MEPVAAGPGLEVLPARVAGPVRTSMAAEVGRPAAALPAGSRRRIRRQRYGRARHVRSRSPGKSGIRHARCRGQTVRVGRQRVHIGQGGIRTTGAERALTLVDAGTRHRVARPRRHLRRWRVRAWRSGRDGRTGMIRSALEHGWRRRRRTVGEPGAIRVRVSESRQSRTAPEVLRIDATLLERRIDPRLKDLIRQQVADHDLEVRSRADCLAERRGVVTQRLQHGCKVVLVFGQNIGDAPQLLEQMVQVRVVLDQALEFALRTPTRWPAVPQWLCRVR